MAFPGKYETISEDHIDTDTEHQSSVSPSMTVAHDLIASNLLCGVEQHVYESDCSDVSVASSSVSVSVPEDFTYTDTNDKSTVLPTNSVLPALAQVSKKRKRTAKGTKRGH